MMQAWKYSLPAFLVPFFFSTTTVGYSLLIGGGNWPDFILATTTGLCSLFFLSLGIIGYLRREFPAVERALLVIVAFAMVIAPIGWSIPGMAPLAVGILMILYHLRVTRGKTRKSEAPV
jgi:TRAP-type uncharacterized transport system fused permease subunit